MIFKKIIKRNGKETQERNFEKLAIHDRIYYNCPTCNKEISKEKVNILKSGYECKTCLLKKVDKNYNKIKETWKNKSEKEFEEIKNKRKQTNLEKYGDENYNNKEKIKQTNLEKYGTDCILKENWHKKYSKKIKLEKYGDTNNLKKIKQTNLEKYGTENVFSNETIKEKIKQTNLKKYGCENPIQNETIKEKIKQTNLKKYGCENPIQNEIIKEKIKQTLFNKYLIDNPGQLETNKINFFKGLEKRNKYLVEAYFNYEEYNGTAIENKYKWKCKKCNKIFEDHIANGRIPRCYNCFPLNNSIQEKKIENFLKENNIEFFSQYYFNDCRNIKPLPFDFYLPKLNICIEYDGQQHFEPIDFFGGEKAFINQLLKDQIKNNYCENNNINLLRLPFYLTEKEIKKRLKETLSIYKI